MEGSSFVDKAAESSTVHDLTWCILNPCLCTDKDREVEYR